MPTVSRNYLHLSETRFTKSSEPLGFWNTVKFSSLKFIIKPQCCHSFSDYKRHFIFVFNFEMLEFKSWWWLFWRKSFVFLSKIFWTKFVNKIIIIFFRNSVRSAFDEDVASEARMTTGLFSKMSKPKYCNTASDEKK